MAAALKRELGLTATLVVGNPGEFTVWVDSRNVVSKDGGEFPSDERAVSAVRAAMSPNPKEAGGSSSSTG